MTKELYSVPRTALSLWKSPAARRQNEKARSAALGACGLYRLSVACYDVCGGLNNERPLQGGMRV